MADIESPEAFAVNWCMHPTCSGGDKPDPCCVGLAAAIRSRDAAVRREATRELRDAAIRGVAELVRLSPPDRIPEKWSGYIERKRVVDIALRIKAAADKALAGGSDD